MSIVHERNMSIECWWGDTDSGEPKYTDRNLSQFHFFYHKSRIGSNTLKNDTVPDIAIKPRARGQRNRGLDPCRSI
jgi:hypothetical protein